MGVSSEVYLRRQRAQQKDARVGRTVMLPWRAALPNHSRSRPFCDAPSAPAAHSPSLT